MIGLEVGYRLIPLVDRNQGGQLLARIKGVRKKLSQDLGFLMPTVHIRDNLDLAPSAYRLTLMGVILAEAEIYPDRELAINPGQVYGTLNGITAKDPAFGNQPACPGAIPWLHRGRCQYSRGNPLEPDFVQALQRVDWPRRSPATHAIAGQKLTEAGGRAGAGGGFAVAAAQGLASIAGRTGAGTGHSQHRRSHRE
jgi:hypothetical protein